MGKSQSGCFSPAAFFRFPSFWVLGLPDILEMLCKIKVEVEVIPGNDPSSQEIIFLECRKQGSGGAQLVLAAYAE